MYVFYLVSAFRSLPSGHLVDTSNWLERRRKMKALRRLPPSDVFNTVLRSLLKHPLNRFKYTFSQNQISALLNRFNLIQVLETELGQGLLRSFIVDNKQDYNTLKQMLTLHDLARFDVVCFRLFCKGPFK